MTDPATLLADQAEEIAGSDTIPVLRMAEILALWGDALLAVLDLHAPAPLPGDVWCMHCSGGDHAEPWPCPTIRKITTALEAR